MERETMILEHAETVGSLLRPPWLMKARDDLARGAMDESAFKAVEDRAVDEAVALQEEAGLPIVTDGEMRRLSFQSAITEAVDGFGDTSLDTFLWGQWHGSGEVEDLTLRRPATLGVVQKLAPRRFFSAHEFAYLKSRTGGIPKITLPSPSLFANFWSPKRSRQAYPNLDSFLADVVDIMRAEVAELARLGASYVQLDAPHYCLLLDARTRRFYESRGWSVERWLQRGLELDNAVIGDVPGVTFGFHL